MSGEKFSFEIDSHWEMATTSKELDFVLDNPLSLNEWWAAVFMKIEVLGGDYYSGEGMAVKLWTKGFLPHTFKFIANVTHDQNKNQVIVKTLGDFGGVGTITRIPGENNTIIHINWQTCVDKHYLYWVMMAVKPIFVANHKWAMRKGKSGLQAEVERRRKDGTAPRIRKQKPTFPHNLLPVIGRVKGAIINTKRDDG